MLQLAPRVGENEVPAKHVYPAQDFNSRPVWGRTSICCIRAPNTSSSNSRPRVGANGKKVVKFTESKYFNSRPRVGANPERPHPQILRNSFNSCPCEGERPWLDVGGAVTDTSTHAPGGTNEKEAIRISQRSELQLPPLAGGEQFTICHKIIQGRSNSRPSVGERTGSHR